MDIQMTPLSGVNLSQTSPPLMKAVTEMVTEGALVFPLKSVRKKEVMKVHGTGTLAQHISIIR